jgi:hypothetical protein
MSGTDRQDEARRILRATATFPVPSHQAYFLLRYGVAARRRRRVLGALAGAAIVGAFVAALVRAAVAAFR